MGRPRVTICKRGHDQTTEGARDKSGACIECTRHRRQERLAAKPPKPVSIRNEVPEDIIAALKELQVVSSATRGCTPLGHESRKAGDLLAEMAANAMDEYGVNPTRLSLQMGLSPHTMRIFLMRRGAIPITPGIDRQFGTYKNENTAGKRGKSQSCKRGHDTTEPGSRYSDGACRQCVLARQNRYYHAKKNAA